jgi:uncharacterized membrane protein
MVLMLCSQICKHGIFFFFFVGRTYLFYFPFLCNVWLHKDNSEEKENPFLFLFSVCIVYNLQCL